MSEKSKDEWLEDISEVSSAIRIAMEREHRRARSEASRRQWQADDHRRKVWETRWLRRRRGALEQYAIDGVGMQRVSASTRSPESFRKSVRKRWGTTRQESAAQARALFDAGHNVQEIADAMERTVATIKSYLRAS